MPEFTRFVNPYKPKSDQCILCGARHNDPGSMMSWDHYYPKCMLGPKTIPKTMKAHPLYCAIFNKLNEHRLCVSCHEEVDGPKINAFLGTTKDQEKFIDDLFGFSVRDVTTLDLQDKVVICKSRGDPLRLVEWNMENYPLSGHVGYFLQQRRKIMATNVTLAEAISQHSGYFFERLANRYKLAAEAALEHNHKLAELQIPGRIYESTHDLTVGVSSCSAFGSTRSTLVQTSSPT